MRILLLHNALAGNESYSDEALATQIRRAGHEVTGIVQHAGQLRPTLARTGANLVVIAGGDGTVDRAVRQLAGTGVPFAVLPLGTANNTALSCSRARCERLPWCSEIAIARGWHDAQLMPFDLGVVHDGRSRRPFTEAVGWGILPSAIERARAGFQPSSPQERLAQNRRTFQAVIQRARPHSYRVRADGRDYSGDYLMVEVTNVPLLGPQLLLSPDSSPGDGNIELVLAGVAERGALSAIASGERADGLRVVHAHEVEVCSADPVLHRDGELRNASRPGACVVRVDAAAVCCLP